MKEIANAYGINDSTHKTDKEDMIVLKVSYLEDMKTFQKLCLYKK